MSGIAPWDDTEEVFKEEEAGESDVTVAPHVFNAFGSDVEIQEGVQNTEVFGEEEVQALVNLIPPVPEFEGRKVDDTEVKISGLSSLDRLPVGFNMGLGARIRLVTEGRVTNVTHVERDGKLIRVHQVKVTNAALAPFDPDDPNDYGVVNPDGYGTGN